MELRIHVEALRMAPLGWLGARNVGDGRLAEAFG